MKISDILRPKTKKEMIDSFCEKNNTDPFELKKLMYMMKWNKQFLTLIKCIFMWIFGFSMLVTIIRALIEDYFWYPIKESNNMFSFINTFWMLCWISISIIIIVFAFVKIINNYDKGTSEKYGEYDRY